MKGVKMESVLNRQRPFTVRASGGKVFVIVMNATDQLPAAFALLGTRAMHKVAIRVGGGCKGMELLDKEVMLEYALDAFEGYQGVIWSGGNRDIDASGQTNIMVTDILGVVALENPSCVALGSVPRTAIMTLQDEGRLVLNEYGSVPNPDQSGVLIVQNGPDGNLDWDGDLKVYFDLMEQWKQYASFSAVGLMTWNGGGITGDEIEGAIKRKWPVFLVKGSGRITDEYVAKVEADDKALPANHRLIVVPREDPNELRKALLREGFLLR
jgi:hypothetical protein